MKKPEYPSSNGSHSSHPKLRLPFQWSTRRRLVTTIVIVFFMLTGVVTAMTYYVVNRQLETVTVNKSFTQAEDADEQHSLNSQAIFSQSLFRIRSCSRKPSRSGCPDWHCHCRPSREASSFGRFRDWHFPGRITSTRSACAASSI